MLTIRTPWRGPLGAHSVYCITPAPTHPSCTHKGEVPFRFNQTSQRIATKRMYVLLKLLGSGGKKTSVLWNYFYCLPFGQDSSIVTAVTFCGALKTSSLHNSEASINLCKFFEKIVVENFFKRYSLKTLFKCSFGLAAVNNLWSGLLQLWH